MIFYLQKKQFIYITSVSLTSLHIIQEPLLIFIQLVQDFYFLTKNDIHNKYFTYKFIYCTGDTSNIYEIITYYTNIKKILIIVLYITQEPLLILTQFDENVFTYYTKRNYNKYFTDIIQEPQATIYNLKVKTEPNTNNAATNIRLLLFFICYFSCIN